MDLARTVVTGPGNGSGQPPQYPAPGGQSPQYPPQPPVPGFPQPPPGPARGPRPSDVVLSVQIWVFVIVASVISRVAQAFSLRGAPEVREQFERDRQAGGFMGQVMKSYPNFEAYDSAIFATAIMMTVAGVVVAALFVFQLWRGVGWARIVLLFLAAFVLVQGVMSFFSGEALIAVPAILAAIAVVGALITANSKQALEFFTPGSTGASPKP